MDLTKLHITYQSNYNGCSVVAEVGDDGFDLYEFAGGKYKTAGNQLMNAITTYAHDSCDEDGEFQGSIANLRKFSTEAAAKLFGPNVAVTFEEDASST